jgi:hypothetical protein
MGIIRATMGLQYNKHRGGARGYIQGVSRSVHLHMCCVLCVCLETDLSQFCPRPGGRACSM